jgi:phosphatidylinositol 4-phosphatase
MIGGKILESQLQRIEVLGVDDTISNHPAFDTNYKVCEYYLYHLINLVS